MLVIIFVSVFIIIGLYIHGDYKEYMAAFEWIRYENMMRPIEEKKAQIEAARKIDYVGGKTPEETLGMYIETLKKGDWEAAVKYYEVAKQEEKLKSLKGSNLDEVAAWNENIKKIGKGSFYNEYYSIGYEDVAKEDVSTTTISLGGRVVPLIIKKGATSTIEKVFVKNSYTNVWKIVQ